MSHILSLVICCAVIVLLIPYSLAIEDKFMVKDVTIDMDFFVLHLNLITFLGVISTVIIFLEKWWKQKSVDKYLQSIPSPPKHWLLGNIPQVLAAVKQKKFFQLLFDWSQQLGPIYVYWFGQPVVILSKPKLIEYTIINGMKNGSLIRPARDRKIWNDLVGPIILGQSGTEWEWRRKAWNPEFSSNNISKYLQIITQACEQTIAKIQEAGPEKQVQVDPLFIELTMGVMSCLLLGIPIDKKSVSPEGPSLDYLKVHAAISVLSYRFLRILTGENIWMKYLPTQNSRNYWLSRRYLKKSIIQRVDLALQMKKNGIHDLAEISPLFQESMLVKIAAKDTKYNRESLMAELIELLAAGTDVIAHTLSFAVGELSLNKRVFQQAQKVVDQAWISQGTITLESLKQLNYIRAIIKETLRLYSVTSGSAALEAKREFVIDGHLIPRGTKVFWSTLGAGKDPEVYPHPGEFLPERWLDNDKENHLLSMINFGLGAHRCLGEHLSILESTVMLALMLKYFDWELVNGRSSLEQLQQNLLIYPSDGMPVYFRLRK